MNATAGEGQEERLRQEIEQTEFGVREISSELERYGAFLSKMEDPNQRGQITLDTIWFSHQAWAEAKRGLTRLRPPEQAVVVYEPGVELNTWRIVKNAYDFRELHRSRRTYPAHAQLVYVPPFAFDDLPERPAEEPHRPARVFLNFAQFTRAERVCLDDIAKDLASGEGKLTMKLRGVSPDPTSPIEAA